MDRTRPSRDEIYALIAEQSRWATLSVSIEEITNENAALVDDMSKYDPAAAIPLLAGLLTLPILQSNCIRLEILVVLAVLHCSGRKKPSLNQAVAWYTQIGKTKSVIGEDPSEDVFVSVVHDTFGDYRVLEGIWECAGFYTQRVLDVIRTMPNAGDFRQIKNSVRALLVISEMVCNKADLYRYQLGSDQRVSHISPRILPGFKALTSRVTFSLAELEAQGVNLNDLQPFLLDKQMRPELLSQEIGMSHLENRPLLFDDSSHVTVALPSALTIAVREYVISNMADKGMTDAFDEVLAKTYSRILFDTPLLGGPTRAPVRWRKVGIHRWSNVCLKVDEGYFISFHFFLPSVQVHQHGHFKSTSIGEDVLVKALESSMNEVFLQVGGKDNFKEGLIILVGCGWGKGHVVEVAGHCPPGWRFESISAADLVRLSCLSEINPQYFWRIQDGLEAVGKAGVHIYNPNGVLNLIGWVRHNKGHFVPHADLPQGEISPEHPLMLNPPINLLRELRADADHGYDRHGTVDNAGVRHDVQRASPNPFFSSESERRMYASITDLEKGTLTSVYEGRMQLWLSVVAPNISNRETVYRLWEMASEWLHRIGKVLDNRWDLKDFVNLKVYAEFHDTDPPVDWGNDSKPAPGALAALCEITPSSESNAFKGTFRSGFLGGFRLADNVSERLFVRTVAGAYLNLLGADDCAGEAKNIENMVVPNDDARSFHFFHAQHFMDYVRDTLPKELISIDPIDDAAVRIGLGWRALEEGHSNKVEGKDACTRYLAKVVDELLSSIFDNLKKFNRVSLLLRLVANCEKAYAEEDHWKRTSAAVLGLHGNEESTLDRYVEQLSKFAGAGITSRILTEIALCVCPAEGGALVSDIELSKLIARAALVARIGGLSDAIFFNALVPDLTISPLGDVLFRDEFGSAVVEPMLTQAMGERVVADAPLQRRNYDEPTIVPSSDGKISDEFLLIWRTEMGFGIDEARNIVGALEDKGVEEHKSIFLVRQSAYFRCVCSKEVSEDVAAKFLDQFALSTRPRWEKPPKGFEHKDIYPWRFGRRLSFVTRPILRVDASDDPLLIIAPNCLRKGFAYVFHGAYSGRFDRSFFRSNEMKNVWLGRAREGHTFNSEVAKALEDAGWTVRENIGLPEIFNGKTDRDFGDVDVLAWRPDKKEVVVVECKDLSLARNYSEVAALLSEYQGAEVGGEPDKLRRHLNRVQLLFDNCERVARFTAVQDPILKSCLVCSGVVPMQYAKIDALADTYVGGATDLIHRLK